MGSEKVQIVEVGPRDGLQNESRLNRLLAAGHIDPEGIVRLRTKLIQKLHAAGLPVIEAGAFVHPKMVPLMAGSAEVLAAVNNLPNVRLPVLVPNIRGFDAAMEAGAREVAFFMSASEEYSIKNTGSTIAASLERLGIVMEAAKARSIPVRGYLSCVFGYKARGDVPRKQVVQLAKHLFDSGCHEISLGDTLAVGKEVDVKNLVRELSGEVPIKNQAAHFHNISGNGIANTIQFIEEGGRVIDSSISGLGGAVTTDDAPGNIPTQAAVALCSDIGFETGVNPDALEEAARYIEAQLSI